MIYLVIPSEEVEWQDSFEKFPVLSNGIVFVPEDFLDVDSNIKFEVVSINNPLIKSRDLVIQLPKSFEIVEFRNLNAILEIKLL